MAGYFSAVEKQPDRGLRRNGGGEGEVGEENHCNLSLQWRNKFSQASRGEFCVLMILEGKPYLTGR